MQKLRFLLLILLWSGMDNTFAITTSDSFDDRFTLGGLNGDIIASTVHNNTLYVGGTFTWMDSKTRLNRIALWDGSAFKPVGEGFNGDVRILKSIDGTLYAGGSFTRSGEVDVNRIARFNEEDQAWEPVGDGFDNDVRALTFHNESIIAGGIFSKSGEESLNYVARWDGDNWQPIGEGFNTSVLALKSYGDTLVAGGHFRQSGDQNMYRMARWDGDSWQPMDQGLREPGTIGIVVLQVSVQSLSIYNNELIAGGNFWLTDDDGHIMLDTQGVARWDGERWRPFGSGLSHSAGSDNFRVSSLLELDGALYAAGSFNQSGDTPLHYIARWQDNKWVNVGNGFDAQVNTLSVLNNEIIAGGRFNFSGENPVHRLARRNNDDNWLTIPEPEPDGKAPSGAVSSLLFHDGYLYAGGGFHKAGDQILSNVGKWDGENWYPLGEGLSGGGVTVLYKYNGELYAGGAFTRSGEKTVNSVGRWDGNTWHGLETNFWGRLNDSGTGTLNPLVYDMVSYGDYLAVAGDFHGRDHEENLIFRIALWDGEKWHRPSTPSQPSFRTASSIVTFQGDLIAGGYTSRDIKESVFRLNTEQNEWETMGEQFVSVNVLTIYNDQLYAAGRLRDEESDEVHNRIARWNGDQWEPVEGVFNSIIRELYTHEGHLYATGHFSEIDGEPAERIARWNGTQWHRFEHRINSTVYTLAHVENDLYLGGFFHTINDQASYHFARWINVPTSAEFNDDDDFHTLVPEQFRILPNYPNPFNPATNIVWEQPEQNRVRITVYDLTGRRIATLVDETRSAGHHEVRFDARNLSSGWYLYRIELTDRSQTLHGQMLLIK